MPLVDFYVDYVVGVCNCAHAHVERMATAASIKLRSTSRPYFKEAMPDIPPVTATSHYEAASLAFNHLWLKNSQTL